MSAEDRYIVACYGLVADMPLVEKCGQKVRIPACDIPLYLADGWYVVPKGQQLINATPSN